VGANVLARANFGEMLKATRLMRGNDWTNPFGDGQASNFIMDYIAPSSQTNAARTARVGTETWRMNV
jgi:hypothetical protein